MVGMGEGRGRIEKLLLKFIRKCKGQRIGQVMLKKKKTVGVLTELNSKIYYKAIVIKS